MIALAGSGSHLFPFVPENGAAAHVNAVLRDLETTERENVRFARAIKKFTSHSGRSGGATEANEHAETQIQWVGPRGGWELGGLQTMFEYVYGTTKTDGRVGRALSGWKHVDKGGFAPTIACIDAASREEFALYAADLLSTVTFDLHIKYSLVCVLLLHFAAVQSAFPSHPLLVRMITCRGAGVERLQFWAQQVVADFQRRNGSSLPDENGQVAVPVVEMTEMTGAIRDCEKELYGVRSDLALLKREMQISRQENAELTSLLRTLLNRFDRHSGDADDGLADRAQEPLAPVSVPHAGLISSHFTRTLPPALTPSSLSLPGILKISLKNVTMSGAFYKWYNEEMWKCVTRDEKERKIQGKFKFALNMLHCFLPADAVVEPKPNELEAYKVWAETVQQWGEQAQLRLKTLCEAGQTVKKRKRVVSTTFEGMTRRVGRLKKKRPDLCAVFSAGGVEIPDDL